MERFWEWLPEPFFLWVAHWLACPERPVDPVESLPTVDEVSATFLPLEDDDKVEEALAFCKWLFDREDETTKTLESKATTLTGFAGVTVALVLGFATLLLDPNNLPGAHMLGAMLILYVLLVYCFVRTILCALIVNSVGRRYTFRYPSSRDILSLSSNARKQIRRQRAVDFFDSYMNNRAINRDKAGYLISAQRAFAIGSMVLFLISVLMAGYMLSVVFRPWLATALNSALKLCCDALSLR
jgi:hypothetical protein